LLSVRKADEMMKEFAKKMKDNLDQLKTIQRRGRFEKRLDKADDDREKKSSFGRVKELNDKIKMKIY
jgi:hypothetical protein